MSKSDSVEKFIHELNEGKDMWCGLDGECFANNVFSVDRTPLCRIDGDKLYISAMSITPKCALYIRELTMRSSQIAPHVFYIPQWYRIDERCHDFSREGIIEAFKDEYDVLKNKKDVYSKAHLENLYKTMLSVNEKCFKVPSILITEAEKTLNKMNKAIRIEDSKIRKFIAENDYYEIVRVAYFDKSTDVKTMTALRRYLNPSGEYAFLNYNAEEKKWYSSETKCGAYKPTMTLEQGYSVGRDYLDGKAVHGMKYGEYIVMKVMENYIQISCNKYTREMMKAAVEHIEKAGFVEHRVEI